MNKNKKIKNLLILAMLAVLAANSRVNTANIYYHILSSGQSLSTEQPEPLRLPPRNPIIITLKKRGFS